MIQTKQMVAAVVGDPLLRRLGWLALIALPFVLAACGRNGSNSGY